MKPSTCWLAPLGVEPVWRRGGALRMRDDCGAGPVGRDQGAGAQGQGRGAGGSALQQPDPRWPVWVWIGDDDRLIARFMNRHDARRCSA